VIGSNSQIGENSHIANDTIIGNNVMMGFEVVMLSVRHRDDMIDIPLIDQGYYDSKPVKVEDGCWIGARSMLLPGITIGANSIVAAGSIVTKDVKPFSIYGGVPAKRISMRKNYNEEN
jgi:maltose O-acetyltransferase